uniref:DUF7792 domain-containing protein n=1 Tax=Ananas comosus var. bracteatus TaxID=296719 RepID=A0A6V7PXM5_ANACO|nr:unnamed protein product [Ananas comosus var. bracteatus]
MLAKPIHLAEQVRKLAGDAQSSRPECAELQVRAERLAALLRQAARAELYGRLAARIIDQTSDVLAKALALVAKCRRGHNLVRRLFTILPANALPRMSAQLDNCIADVSWLLRLSSPQADDDGLHGLPNIARDEPMLCLIWEHIARLHTGSSDARADSAAQLASLARDSDHFAKLIIEEDGVGPLVRFLKEGSEEGQESAARALGYLGRDPESVEHLVHAGACSAFAQVLKDAPIRVQAAAAWAVAELAAHHPECQDVFFQHNVVRLLVVHLAHETVQEHSRYSVVGPSKAMSLHSVVLAHTKSIRAANQHQISQPSQHQNQHQSHNQIHSVVQSAIAAKSTNGIGAATALKSYNNLGPGPSKGRREAEDPETKAYLKAMAANALWRLAQGNISICRSITESCALLCFAVLLEKGVGRVRYYSAMALMEIARVAEHNVMLRQSAFKPSSPTAKAVVDQLLRIVWNGVYDELLQPSITALGCLSRTFQASEARIIGPLVVLLDESEAAVSKEAVIALTKFACSKNHLHVNHCKAVIDAGGARHLVQLVYLGEQVQIEALILLCYIALHVPDSEELAQAGVLAVLLWASKQAHMVQDSRVESLLPEAKARMELFQSRESR